MSISSRGSSTAPIHRLTYDAFRASAQFFVGPDGYLIEISTKRQNASFPVQDTEATISISIIHGDWFYPEEYRSFHVTSPIPLEWLEAPESGRRARVSLNLLEMAPDQISIWVCIRTGCEPSGMTEFDREIEASNLNIDLEWTVPEARLSSRTISASISETGAGHSNFRKEVREGFAEVVGELLGLSASGFEFTRADLFTEKTEIRQIGKRATETITVPCIAECKERRFEEP